jgi:CheY-like chemotaxis protein
MTRGFHGLRTGRRPTVGTSRRASLLAERRRAREARAPCATQVGGGGRVNQRGVLIVEDDPLAARTLTQMLPRDLMRRRATTASTAIRILRAHADWALFLIDVGLGEGGSGLDVLHVAIAEHPSVVRALVTGDDSAHLSNHARALSTDVIRKPFSRTVLAPTLARALSSRASSDARRRARHAARSPRPVDGARARRLRASCRGRESRAVTALDGDREEHCRWICLHHPREDGRS